MKRNKQFRNSTVRRGLLGLILLVSMRLSSQAAVPPQAQPQPLEARVRHAIVMQPFYTVFDNIKFSVSGDTVTLEGQVIRPSLKPAVEHSVRQIAGVSKVVSNIEVLPPLPFDNSIRRATFRSIYAGNGPLSGYGWGPVPAIHIIVDHGRVTLTGTVDRQVDKDMATLLAKTVSNVFSVDNQLIVR